MVQGMHDPLRTFGATIAALDEELDWELLGICACEGDGSTFFDAALRERTIDTGLRFAEDVARALGGSRGASLYVGAEIAELPVLLVEHLVLGRAVEWVNLDCAAVRELRRALAAVGARAQIELPSPRAVALQALEPAGFDHVWMTSVLTDPDAFPALHDELYERAGGPLATGRGSLDDERARAETLVEALLANAAPRTVLTTTDEELRILEPIAVRRGWRVEFPRDGRLSAIVGDRVRTGTIQRELPDLTATA
jgi:hypothetical protein